eukprot:gene85-357_t
MAAESLRIRGNAKFSDRDYVEAKAMYRLALQAHPKDAPSWCNMAACDIELALEAVKADQAWWKAHFRLALCLRSLQGFKSAAAHFNRAAVLGDSGTGARHLDAKAIANLRAQAAQAESSALANDEDLPYRLLPSPAAPPACAVTATLAGCVGDAWGRLIAVADVPAAGGTMRGLTAKTDLAQGKIFLREQALASATFSESLCGQCFQPVGISRVVCPSCQVEAFCCSKCRSDAIAGWHRLQCGEAARALRAHAAAQDPPNPTTALKGSPSTNHQPPCEDASPKTDATALKAPPLHISDTSPHKLLVQLAMSSSGTTSGQLAGGLAPSCASRLAQYEEIERILAPCGLPSGFIDFEWYCWLWEVFNVNVMATGSDDDEVASLLLWGSLLNHSCNPNATYTSQGDTLTFYTRNPVRKGDALTISYIDTAGPCKKQRRRQLQQQYFFVCRCEMCNAGSSS